MWDEYLGCIPLSLLFIPLGTHNLRDPADTMPIQWLDDSLRMLLTILGVVLRFIRSFYREGLPETAV